MKMKNNWILIGVLALITTPFAASAQARPSGITVGTPSTAGVPAKAQNGDAAVLAEVLAVPESQPLGPPDLLKEYEGAMAETAQGFNAEVSRIAEAVQQQKITEEQGEFLCKEAYELAMMQFQVLSGLHDMLEEELSQTPAAQAPASPAPAAGYNGSGYRNDVRTVRAMDKSI
jgi:hypothetical protein